ncbi:bile acid:sodium symporter family protein [Niallia sp. 01092]|uniref:bile acid:sodium symporter family protein n=1 Tax=Niallia sp. 01092 TaxID=3457759 RepID=UPI003FD31189
MLVKLDSILVKILPIMTPICLVSGILVGVRLEQFTYLIPWIFALMTFSGSLGSSFKQFKHVIHHPLPIITVLVILHVIIPFWNWGLSHIFFYGEELTITGFILMAVIPTGVTSFVWTTIYKGNIPLVLSIILIDTFLSPIVVPFTLKLFIGKSININTGELMMDLFLMVVLPSLLGMILNEMTSGKIKNALGPKLSPISKLGVFIIVFINGGIISSYLANFDWKILLTIAIVFMVVVSGYLFSWFIGRLLKMEKSVNVSLTFSGGMRNIAAGTVLAVSNFSAPVAIPVIFGMLFQQVSAAIIGKILYGKEGKSVRKLTKTSVKVNL